MENILCKENYFSQVSKTHFWSKDMLYTFEKRSGWVRVGSNLKHQVISDRNFNSLSNIFYSVDETKNILRTKLIDKMLISIGHKEFEY